MLMPCMGLADQKPSSVPQLGRGRAGLDGSTTSPSHRCICPSVASPPCNPPIQRTPIHQITFSKSSFPGMSSRPAASLPNAVSLQRSHLVRSSVVVLVVYAFPRVSRGDWLDCPSLPMLTVVQYLSFSQPPLPRPKARPLFNSICPSFVIPNSVAFMLNCGVSSRQVVRGARPRPYPHSLVPDPIISIDPQVKASCTLGIYFCSPSPPQTFAHLETPLSPAAGPSASIDFARLSGTRRSRKASVLQSVSLVADCSFVFPREVRAAVVRTRLLDCNPLIAHHSISPHNNKSRATATATATAIRFKTVCNVSPGFARVLRTDQIVSSDFVCDAVTSRQSSSYSAC
nr:hypothetical protein CFP56_33792 [Quercus suber]